jgi:hypothetical protein
MAGPAVDPSTKGTRVSSIYRECADALQQVAAVYRGAHSCPCAYPRFRQLAEFDFRRYGTTPVGCHVTDLAIGLLLGVKGGDGFMKNESASGGWPMHYRCRVCGSEGEMSGEQYNIHMEVTWFRWRTLPERQMGAAPEERIPMPRGFYGLGTPGMNACADAFSREADFEAMTSYLTAGSGGESAR